MSNTIAEISDNRQSSQGSKFDIREHIEKLEPTNQKDKYICPVCGGNDFSVNPHTGAYHCFNNECEPKDIRNAIAPREKNFQRVIPRSFAPKLKQLGLPSGVTLVRIDGVNIPQPSKPGRIPSSVKNKLREGGATPEELNQIMVISYPYGGGKHVHRYECPCAAIEKGRSKTFSQSHIAEDGTVKYQKGNDPWPGYCLDEAITAVGVQSDGIPLFLLQEGEDCVDIARSNGIASFTFQGSSWKDQAIKTELTRLKNGVSNAVIAFLHDNDDVGVKKAQKVEEVCSKLRIPFVAINPRFICAEIPNKGDIKEILGQMDMDEFIRRLEDEIHKAVDGDSISNDTGATLDGDFISNEIDPLETFNQQAFGFFFYDRPWICVDNILYEWQEEGYYKLVKDAYLIPKIASFCNTFAVWNEKKEVMEYPYAKTSCIEETLKWAKARTRVSDELVNPPGINCSNGILRVFWEKNKPTFKLIPHSQSEYYLYPGLVEYDPDAKSPECDRLLECLDDAQRQIFLRNISAAFDLANVRRIRGRTIKGLFPCGVGSNGKDALRAIVSLIFGHQGITSKTLADFQQYDEGRKFSLASLRHSQINWASENPKTIKLDSLQSLKAYLTGQKLVSEKKGADGEDFTPYGIGLWNLNELPNLQGSLQSSIDRYAPLTFRYIYKDDPDPTNKYELKADPRFVYDEDFQRLEVAPTFLNHMVNAFYALIEEGIDYTCTHEAYQQIQIENNHLFQFASDIGLSYKPDSEMSASVLWELLKPWYINEGILTIGDNGKHIWGETNRPSDHPIKALNQVISKIHKIFPKAKVGRVSHPSGKKSISVITGIGIVDSSIPHPNSTPIPPQLPPQKTLVNQDLHPNHPNFSTPQNFEEKKESISMESQNSQMRNAEKNNSNSSQNNFNFPHSEIVTSKTGVGGVEPLYSKDDWGGDGGATGVENDSTGVGNEVKPDVNVNYSPNGLLNDSLDKQELFSTNFVEQEIDLDEHPQSIKKAELSMNDNSVQNDPSVSSNAPSPEDFAPGMEVTFNRQLASQSSSQRIPASVTRGVVVKIGAGNVLVDWEGLEQPQWHNPVELESASN